MAAYCRRTGRAGIPHWEFYLIFNMFRIAAILHGVLARALQGNAASHNAIEQGSRARLVAEVAQGHGGSSGSTGALTWISPIRRR